MAPLAAASHGELVQPVFIANGIGDADIAWLSSICPDVPILRLKTSLRGNASSLLAHGSVIDILSQVSEAAFCIQDADCFVIDSSFWHSMRLDETKHYATGPFLRAPTGSDRPDYPETFLLLLNSRLMSTLRRSEGIRASATDRPNRRARRMLKAAGYPSGRFLETLKQYYDTLQQYWVAASYRGYSYNHVTGEGKSVFHIGGTSYLYEDFSDLPHWDYWALNVQYFHLRLLELPACEQFRDRFAKLRKFHGKPSNLIRNHPDFASGWRRAQSDSILECSPGMKVYRGVS
jgi:hypothetical protein